MFFSKLLRSHYCLLHKRRGASINTNDNGNANIIFILRVEWKWNWAIYNHWVQLKILTNFSDIENKYNIFSRLSKRWTKDISLQCLSPFRDKDEKSSILTRTRSSLILLILLKLTLIELVFRMAKRILASNNSIKWIEFSKEAG